MLEGLIVRMKLLRDLQSTSLKTTFDLVKNYVQLHRSIISVSFGDSRKENHLDSLRQTQSSEARKT